MNYNTFINIVIFNSQPVKDLKKIITYFQGYTKENNHLVAPSPWPLLTSEAVFGVVVSLTAFMHNYLYSHYFLFFSIFSLLLSMGSWWRDVIREATFEGQHNSKVQLGLRLGMILFIISEIMFFVAFFLGFLSL